MPRSATDEELLEAARGFMRISLRAADRIGGVSVVQLRALTVLHRQGPANLGRLAEEMGVTVSTASRLVDRLVAAGLVDRRIAAHTRREVSLRLTARARATLSRYDDLRLASLQECLDGLPDEQREAAVRGLRAFGAAAAPAPSSADGRSTGQTER
jgi:DNA-binding MarR family transcriptional regulator